MKVPVRPSHAVTPSTMLHLAGSEKCKADHYQWRAVLLRRSTALLPAPQRKWENTANVYSPYECVCVGKVCVCMLGAEGGHVMCTSNAWGLTSVAKQLPGLFTISQCADFRGFGVQMFRGCVCRSTCVVRCVMPGAATMMSAFTPLTLINPESSGFWSLCNLWYSVSCSAETDQWGESSIIC